MNYTFRPYTSADIESCLRIFDSNLPDAMTIQERDGFISDLHRLNFEYFVIEDTAGMLVACGGFIRESARICWTMVDSTKHKKGIGSLLLQSILRRLHEVLGNVNVTLDTSPYAKEFYLRQGFVVERTTEHYYGKDNHRYDMVLKSDLKPS